ncbi:MAG: phage virion morphogenesis protein [Candidatus Thorarchaeota archaeon]
MKKAEQALKIAKKEVQKTPPLWDKAVIILEKSQTKTFRLQGRPKWKKTARGGKVLQLSNRMMQSVTASSHPAAVRKYGKRTLVFGTKIIYAPSHQFGFPKRGIPERKFLAVYDEDIKMMEKVFAEDIEHRVEVSTGG